MFGGDVGFHNVSTVMITIDTAQEAQCGHDLGMPPSAAILVGQQDRLARVVDASVATSVVQEHQREEPGDLGFGRHERPQHPSDADRRVGGVDVPGRVAVREHQVDDR